MLWAKSASLNDAMADQNNIPDQLRQRLLRQRRKARIILTSFAVTALATLGVFVLMSRTQGFAAAARVLYAQAGPGGSFWLVDQRLPVTGQDQGGGSFRLLSVTGEEVTAGPAYNGMALGAAQAGDGTFLLTTESQVLRFAQRDDTWELKDSYTLGLNDAGAGPVCAVLDGTPWLFWLHGNEVHVRPARDTGAGDFTVFKTASPGTRLHVVGTSGAIWLTVLEGRTGKLSILAVAPKLAPSPSDRDADAPPNPGEAARPTPTKGTTAQILRRAQLPALVSRASLAVMGTDTATAVPVVAYTRKDDASRDWSFSALLAGDKPEGQWMELPSPARAGAASALDAANFVTLLGGKELHAWFSDGGTVKYSSAPWQDPEKLSWTEPQDARLDGSQSLTAQLGWAVVLFVLGLALMSQGVWLVLNRERPQDRAINQLLQRTGMAKEKPENKLVFASGPARGMALLIDLAVTSPLVMLAQGLYQYRLEDAYGFIVLVSFGQLDTGIVQVIAASLVTLSLLVIYSLFCELMWGRTLGKALFRLRVVDNKGETPSPWRIVVRNLLKIVEMVHWTVLMLPLGLMLFSGRQQRLGDLLGGTLVIVEVVPEESTDDIDI